MKLLLVNPRTPDSFWAFRWAFGHVAPDKRALLPPLGLATVAALTPPGWDVTIIDENAEPIPWDFDADVVGVGGMAVQFPRQVEILEQFRKRGRYVVAGGSYASLCPEEYAAAADTVVAGEAEYTWPRFCADFARGAPRPLYRETGTVDLADSPVPRFDLLRLDRYPSASVQFSRGCPFRCEFCDIIVTFGRKPRAKPLAQVERELDALRRLGARSVFFVDDNLIGHLPRCTELLHFLAAYRRRHRWRGGFGAETSLNVATKPDLLRLLKAAGFDWVFVGVETPDRAALVETKKEQNTRADPLAALRAIYAAGLDVYASFVVGFDADDAAAFDRQFRFIVEAGVVFASVALLLALPKTPLHDRLKAAGRLRPAGTGHRLWDNMVGTNVEPAKMSYDELVAGFRGLVRRLADDAAIADRVRNKLRHVRRPAAPFRVPPGQTLAYLGRFLLAGVLRGGPRRWYHFARSLVPAARDPRLVPFAVANWVFGLSIQAFVAELLAGEGEAPRSS